MNTKFCSNCSSYQEETTGYNVKNKSGAVLRWRCAECHRKATQRERELGLPKRQTVKTGPKEK